MPETDSYRTIAKSSKGMHRDRGSKFLAFAYPVKSVDEIKFNLNELRKQYHDARHHCYAYRLGVSKKVYRENDDGEPSNSAGKPILGQIKYHDLTNILIVVVRYFGGTLLGVGGLINAYRTAAADAIHNASIINEVESEALNIIYSYSLTNDIMKLVEAENMVIQNQEFAEACKIRVMVPLHCTDKVLERINKLPGAHAEKEQI